jgi:hypothetical protein
MSISSLNIKCCRSVLKAPELALFNHMAEKRKTKRALNDIRNIGFEKKRWLILESIVEDTKFYRRESLYQFLQDLTS